MCVTANPAVIRNTKTFVYATHLDGRPVHVCGYQNEAQTTEGNCMFLNFPAQGRLQLVRGPELTKNGDLMRDMTDSLEELVYVPRMRSASFSFSSKGLSVEEYGDYTVIIAQGPTDILSALDEVPPHRRPQRSIRLGEMVDFYMSWSPRDRFVLACFDGKAKPGHPITVSYKPRDWNVLTIPGLDGHDGTVPTVGAPVYRNFSVAFGFEGLELPHRVRYIDPLTAGAPWAPNSIAGFIDNRRNGPNGDYRLPLDALTRGLTGPELAAALL